MGRDIQEYEEEIKRLETELQKTSDTLHNYRKEQEEFILIASHDLQAPLRKLSTFVERLTNKVTDLPEEARTYIERIQSAAIHMRSLIEGLSDLSGVIETEHSVEKCDLDTLLENILKNMQYEENANITYSHLPVIEGNCTLLKHLFQNLLDNAIKFQKKDSPLQIDIHSKEINDEEKRSFDLPPDKIYYQIEIADKGIGFEDKYAERIFKPFQRLHGKAEYEGNGMGLAICKKIIEKHKGIMYANGDKDKGARFILILPQTSD